MAVNFPTQIEVTMGSAWNGDSTPPRGLGLNVGDKVVLNQVGATDVYTEDGTTTPAATNRLHMTFSAGPSGGNARRKADLKAPYYTGGTWTTFRPLFYIQWYYVPLGTNVMNYSPGDLLDNNGTPWATNSYSTGYYSASSTVWAPSMNRTIGSAYKPKVFSLIEAYVAPAGLAPDKTTYRYG